MFWVRILAWTLSASVGNKKNSYDIFTNYYDWIKNKKLHFSIRRLTEYHYLRYILSIFLFHIADQMLLPNQVIEWTGRGGCRTK